MEEKQRKTTTGLLITLLVAIVIIVVMGVELFLLIQQNKQAEEKNKELESSIDSIENKVLKMENDIISFNEVEKNEVTTSENIVENVVDSATTQIVEQSERTKEDIIEGLYMQLLACNENWIDYRVDEVTIRDSEDMEWLDNFDSDNIYALVEYSVKPKDIDTGLAGNGTQEGDWIVQKVACVTIEKKNGQYIITGDGTGW